MLFSHPFKNSFSLFCLLVKNLNYYTKYVLFLFFGSLANSSPLLYVLALCWCTCSVENWGHKNDYHGKWSNNCVQWTILTPPCTSYSHILLKEMIMNYGKMTNKIYSQINWGYISFSSTHQHKTLPLALAVEILDILINGMFQKLWLYVIVITDKKGFFSDRISLYK